MMPVKEVMPVNICPWIYSLRGRLIDTHARAYMTAWYMQNHADLHKNLQFSHSAPQLWTNWKILWRKPI